MFDLEVSYGKSMGSLNLMKATGFYSSNAAKSYGFIWKVKEFQLVLEEQLSQWIDEKRLFRSSDPFEYLKSIEPPVNSVAFEKRAQAYRIIEPIVYDTGCFNEEIRAKRVRLVEQTNIATKATIYKYLRRYWQRGQIPNALLPDYRNAGAPGKPEP